MRRLTRAFLSRRVPGPLWALALGIGCVMVVVGAGSATAGTVIHVSSSDAEAGQGAASNVAVSLGPSDSMNAFDVTVSFAPSIARVNSVSVGPGWTELVNTFDNTAGTLHVAGFQLGAGCGPGTNCTVFIISWLAVSPGDNAAHVTLQQLAGTNSGTAGTLLSVAATDGGVVVSAPAQPSSPAPAETTTALTMTATATSTTDAVSAGVTTTPVTASVMPATTTAAPSTLTPVASTTTSASTTAPASSSPATVAPPAQTNTSAPVILGGSTSTTEPAPSSPPPTSGPLIGGQAPGPRTSQPVPPAAGSGQSAAPAATDPLRLSGIGLIALSTLALALHGAGSLRARRRVVAHQAIAPAEAPPPIAGIIDRYLDRVESRARLDRRSDEDRRK